MTTRDATYTLSPDEARRAAALHRVYSLLLEIHARKAASVGSEVCVEMVAKPGESLADELANRGHQKETMAGSSAQEKVPDAAPEPYPVSKPGLDDARGGGNEDLY